MFTVGYVFTQPVHLSAGVVVSVAGVLMAITTALIIIVCVMMKRRQAFNITSECIKLIIAVVLLECIWAIL